MIAPAVFQDIFGHIYKVFIRYIFNLFLKNISHGLRKEVLGYTISILDLQKYLNFLLIEKISFSAKHQISIIIKPAIQTLFFKYLVCILN